MQNHPDSVKRAVDNGANIVKAVTKCPMQVPGAGAAEVEQI